MNTDLLRATLERPVWLALNGPQRAFGVVQGQAARYRPEISPLAGLGADTPAAMRDLAAITAPGETVALAVAQPLPEAHWQQHAAVELGQWVCHQPLAVEPANDAPEQPAIVELGPAHGPAMLALARLADPGPFEAETWRLGTYLGIFNDDDLVAMAGERMCPPGCAEVSGVATRPGHEGNGYARRLVAELVRRQQRASQLPFLHVRVGSPAEAAASHVYARLGFERYAQVTLRIVTRR